MRGEKCQFLLWYFIRVDIVYGNNSPDNSILNRRKYLLVLELYPLTAIAFLWHLPQNLFATSFQKKQGVQKAWENLGEWLDLPCLLAKCWLTPRVYISTEETCNTGARWTFAIYRIFIVMLKNGTHSAMEGRNKMYPLLSLWMNVARPRPKFQKLSFQINSRWKNMQWGK